MRFPMAGIGFLAGPNGWLEPILRGNEGTNIRVAVSAPRVIGPIEIHDPFAVWAAVTFVRQIEIPSGSVALLAAGLIAERHEQPLLVWIVFVGLQRAFLTAELETKLSPPPHVPLLTAGILHIYDLLLIVPVQLHLVAVLRVRRPVGESLESRPIFHGQRRLRTRSEEKVLLPSFYLDALFPLVDTHRIILWSRSTRPWVQSLPPVESQRSARTLWDADAATGT